MATGCPDRQRCFSRPLRRRGRSALILALALFAAAGAAPDAAVADVAAAPDSLPLERIDYRRDGLERQAVGEVMLAGDRVRLRLFSDELATHYEVWVDLADFIAATPLGSEESARIRGERAAAITSHLAEREAARARRAAAKEREAAERSARGGAPTGSRRASARGGSAAPPGSAAGDPPAGAGKLDLPAGEAPLPRSTAELADLAGAIATRHETAAARAAELLGEIAERFRIPGARSTLRPLRDLADRVEEAGSALERIESSLGGRRGAMGRIESESAEGALRGRALAEQIESVGAQLVRLSGDLTRVEEVLDASERDLGAIHAEPPPAPPAPAPLATAPGAAEPRAPTRRPARESAGDGEPVRSARAAEGAPVPAALPAAIAEPADPETPARAGERTRPERARDRATATSPDAEDSALVRGEGPRGEDEPREAAGGGLPIWPLYVVAALSLYFLWRGSRPREPAIARGPERGAEQGTGRITGPSTGRGPERPDESSYGSPRQLPPVPRRSGPPLR